MRTWLIVVPMVGAAAIVRVPTIDVILLTGPNAEDDSARPARTLSQPGISEPEAHHLPMPAKTAAGTVLALFGPRGSAPCLARAA
ncbi:MAG: hypothetical protein M3237_16460 [Actinomycetota bacterium]|nr:hypothetical protein [Actinomycetota bacterium]